MCCRAKKQPRKPRQKTNYSLPVNIVKKQFVHFAGLRVSKEAVEEVMKVYVPDIVQYNLIIQLNLNRVKLFSTTYTLEENRIGFLVKHVEIKHQMSLWHHKFDL